MNSISLCITQLSSAFCGLKQRGVEASNHFSFLHHSPESVENTKAVCATRVLKEPSYNASFQAQRLRKQDGFRTYLLGSYRPIELWSGVFKISLKNWARQSLRRRKTENRFRHFEMKKTGRVNYDHIWYRVSWSLVKRCHVTNRNGDYKTGLLPTGRDISISQERTLKKTNVMTTRRPTTWSRKKCTCLEIGELKAMNAKSSHFCAFISCLMIKSLYGNMSYLNWQN